MRIEIKANFRNDERKHIYEVANECINNNYMISERNNGEIILECVPEKYAKEIKNLLGNKYEINVTDDTFMAHIDMLDLLMFE